MLIDLHTHSYPKSDDSFMDVDTLVERSKALGLDGVCLTDHDAFWTWDEVRVLQRRHDFLVIPGTELNTDSGHVLVFGLHRYEFGVHKPEFLWRLADRQGAVIIAAHPYRRRFLEDPGQNPEAREGMLGQAARDTFFELCDALETRNGRGTGEENRFSSDLRGILGLPGTAGSDAHRPEQLGTAATRFTRRIHDLEDLVTELKRGACLPVDLARAGLNRPDGKGGSFRRLDRFLTAGVYPFPWHRTG